MNDEDVTGMYIKYSLRVNLGNVQSMTWDIGHEDVGQDTQGKYEDLGHCR